MPTVTYNDISNLYKNIGYLIKAYNVRIGDLEKAIGVSAGYISRSAGVDMPISKVLKIADFFEITVDELVRGNYRKAFLEGEIKRLQKELDALELAKEQEKDYLEEYGCPACEFYNADTKKCESPSTDPDCEYEKNFGRTLDEVLEDNT